MLLACTVVLASIALIRWQATLSCLGSSLIRSQPPQQTDLILVLGGDFWGPRVLKAAELVTGGYAPLALISGPPYAGRPEGELAVDFLVQKGYPRDRFQIFAHTAGSTVAEAIALRGELARRRVQRVILVTSAYHSRRAAFDFWLFCPDIHFISVPAPDALYHADGWWRDDTSRNLFWSEWTKMLGTALIAYPTYRVSRWISAWTAPS